jgi:hypothetical protein
VNSGRKKGFIEDPAHGFRSMPSNPDQNEKKKDIFDPEPDSQSMN